MTARVWLVTAGMILAVGPRCYAEVDREYMIGEPSRLCRDAVLVVEADRSDPLPAEVLPGAWCYSIHVRRALGGTPTPSVVVGCATDALERPPDGVPPGAFVFLRQPLAGLEEAPTAATAAAYRIVAGRFGIRTDLPADRIASYLVAKTNGTEAAWAASVGHQPAMRRSAIHELGRELRTQPSAEAAALLLSIAKESAGGADHESAALALALLARSGYAEASKLLSRFAGDPNVAPAGRRTAIGAMALRQDGLAQLRALSLEAGNPAAGLSEEYLTNRLFAAPVRDDLLQLAPGEELTPAELSVLTNRISRLDADEIERLRPALVAAAQLDAQTRAEVLGAVLRHPRAGRQLNIETLALLPASETQRAMLPRKGDAKSDAFVMELAKRHIEREVAAAAAARSEQ